MIDALFGIKTKQTQRFLQDGARIPVTEVRVSGNTVITAKNMGKDGYWSLQVGIETQKNANKPLLGHIKGAAMKDAPHFLREIRLADELSSDQMPEIGQVLKAASVFQAGDIVDVVGVSKGKGFAGGVKRHHFKGGPRTHGQSDRERAPGSIGQTTTPGRVYKGKRMAGRMGSDRVTIRNVQVVEVGEEGVLIKGLVPGSRNSLVMIRKVGEGKKFVPLYKAEETKETQGTEGEKVEKVEVVEKVEKVIEEAKE